MYSVTHTVECYVKQPNIYIYIYKFTSKCHSQTTPSSERR